MIEALLSLGVFIAVPLTGYAVIGTRLETYIPPVARPSIWVAAGAAIWSVPLLVLISAGVYSAVLLGAVAWLAAAALVVRYRRELSRPQLDRVDAVVLASLFLFALLAAAFPADPFVSTFDQNTYASHAIYIVNHGQLGVPYATPPGDPSAAAVLPPGNLFLTQPEMTVRFSNLWPDWLAQTYASFGWEGLVRLNVVLSVLALLVVYGFAKRLVPSVFAAGATLFLAFNPAQVWVTRQTLSEIATELFIWCGLLLLTAHLRSGSQILGAWAGALLAASAFVHIDGFALLPFLLFSHALWRVVVADRPHSPRIAWKYFYAASAPVFGLAIAYYWLFSNPYFVELKSQLALIGAAAFAGLVLLALTYSKRLASFFRSLLDRREVVLGGLVLVAVLAAYAYFVRPLVPPFVTFNVPGAAYDGLRTYVEDALRNLGAYLTPGVVWVGILGWSVLIWRTVRHRSSSALIPLLIVAAGFTALYVWNQSAWPNHFWAIRRFVPVIIPALVVFSSVGIVWTLKFLSRPGRRLALAAATPLLVVYTLIVGIPMYVVSEGAGTHQGLAQFAASVPSDGRAIALDGVFEAAHYWMPLYLAYDRPITPINVASDEGRAEAIRILSAASAADPVPVVTAAYDYRMDAVVGSRETDVSWTAPLMAETTNPVPRTETQEQSKLTLIEASGLNTLGVAFGGPPQWVASTTGYHRPQVVDGRPLRWTNGDGVISIPIIGATSADAVSVSLADTGPDGGPLHVVLNGVTIFNSAVPAGPWTATFPLPNVVDLAPGTTATLELISDSFVNTPVDQADHLTDFGVQVDQIIFSANGQ